MAVTARPIRPLVRVAPAFPLLPQNRAGARFLSSIAPPWMALRQPVAPARVAASGKVGLAIELLVAIVADTSERQDHHEQEEEGEVNPQRGRECVRA